LLRTYTQDEQGNKYLTRNMYIRVQKLINDFIAGEKEVRIVSVPGLRGVGKTTLLAQLYLTYFPRFAKDMLYVSADQVVNELGSDLYTVLEEYQKITGVAIEKLDHDVFLFIDEIHFDKKWTSVLKTLYDRSKRVFVVCTGSSALSLQSTTDLARRVVFEKLYPMNFTEYMLLMIAGSGEVSITSLAKGLQGISLVTLANVLEALEKAEVLIRVYPYGSTYKKVRKPSKYHFMTPAVRHAF